MTNHVHLVVRPERADSLARTIGEVHGQHARSLHRAHGWDGHLWANRYYSAVLGPDRLWAAVRYVERNPVRAGLADVAENYRWSSARAHCGLAADRLLSLSSPFPGPISDWRTWLAGGPDEEAEQAIRSSTAAGRPAGGSEFVAHLEARLGRRLDRRPLARPRNAEPATP
jgi:putative transposase